MSFLFIQSTGCSLLLNGALGARLQTRPGCDKELQAHDGLVGSVFTAAGVANLLAAGSVAALGGNVVVLGVSGLMMASAFSGWCPVHHALKIVGFKQGHPSEQVVEVEKSKVEMKKEN